MGNEQKEQNFAEVQAIDESTTGMTIYFSTQSDRQFYIEQAQRRERLGGCVPKFGRLQAKRAGTCSSNFPLYLEMPKVDFRLADKPELTTQQAVYVLTNLLETCKLLEQKYEFEFTEQKVGFTQEGTMLFWVHDNYFKHSSLEGTAQSQVDNRERIVQAVSKRCASAEFQSVLRVLRERGFDSPGGEGRVSREGLVRQHRLLQAKEELVLKYYKSTSLSDIVPRGTFGWSSQLTTVSSQLTTVSQPIHA